MRRLLTALCLLACCAVPLSADEATSVENPVYARWKNHPVGTEVRYRQHTQAQGVDERRLMVYRLTEKTADQLTVEIRTRQEEAAESDETVQVQTARPVESTQLPWPLQVAGEHAGWQTPSPSMSWV
ncbi:MAG: hypothetical protein ACK6D0_00945, partial [Planctomyces sp.]